MPRPFWLLTLIVADWEYRKLYKIIYMNAHLHLLDYEASEDLLRTIIVTIPYVLIF